MAERTNARLLKSRGTSRFPWVRIPLPPLRADRVRLASPAPADHRPPGAPSHTPGTVGRDSRPLLDEIHHGHDGRRCTQIDVQLLKYRHQISEKRVKRLLIFPDIEYLKFA